MTNIAEAILAGLIGAMGLVMILLILFLFFCSVVFILCRIPSIPIYARRNSLYYRDEEVLERGDWDFFKYIGMWAIVISASLTALYLLGFVLIEYGGMTIETSK